MSGSSVKTTLINKGRYLGSDCKRYEAEKISEKINGNPLAASLLRQFGAGR
jgi:hypothetical protein